MSFSESAGRDLASERSARQSAESAWRRISLLQDVAVRLAAASSVEEVAEALVNEGSRALEADAGLFSTVDGPVGGISLRASQGVARQVVDFYWNIPVDSPNPVAEVVRSGSPVFVGSNEERQRMWPDLPYQGAAAFVLHPLTVRGSTRGVLGFGFADSHPFSADERELISTIAGMSSQAFHRAELSDATERAVRRSTLLEGVTRRLIAGENPEQIANTIITGLLPALGAESGGLFIVEPSTRALQTLALRDGAGARHGDEVVLDDAGPASEAIRTGMPVFIADDEEWRRRYGRLDHVLRGAAVTATAHLPLVVDGEPIATLALGFAGDHDFDDTEQQTLAIVAGICAQALGRAIALQEVRAANTRLAAIDTITDIALSRLSLQELLEQLPRRVADATESAAVRILLLEGNLLYERGRYGVGDRSSPGIVPVGQGLSGEVAATGQSQVVVDISRHEVIQPAFPEGITTVAGVPLRSGGRVIGVLDAGVGPDREFTSADVDLLELAADRVAAAIDRTRAYEAERASRLRLELLGRLDEIVNGSGPFETMVGEIATLTVGALADACVITVITDEGQLVVPADGDPDFVEMSKWITQHDLITGPATYSVTADQIRQAAHDPELGRLLEELDVGHVLAVRLPAQSEPVGSMLLVRTGDSEGFGLQEASLVRDIADRMGAAIASRLSFERHRTAALALQRSLLPAQIPEVPGFELAARYWPGSDRFEVAGDFYDVIELPHDRWGILIGDVSGKGLAAAAMTGIARHTARAAAVHGLEPDLVLRWIHDAFLVQSGTIETFCTGIFGVLEHADGVGRFRFAIGGHPFPVKRSADEVRFVGEGGTVLGLVDSIHVEVTEVTLDPGDWLILYTDGVTDVPVADPITDPELLDVIDQACVGSPEHALSSLEEVVRDRYAQVDNRDDTAIMVVKFVGDKTGSG